jgi:hypothetical protein
LARHAGWMERALNNRCSRTDVVSHPASMNVLT